MKLVRKFAVTALSAAVIAGGVSMATASSAEPAPVSKEAAPFTSKALDGGKVPCTQDATQLTQEQIDNARTIIAVGKGAELSTQAQKIAVMTALQESSLINVDGGDRDSAGLFQQRPSMGWGTLAQVTDPIYSSKSFYGVNPEGANRGLIQVPGWETLSPGAAAQAVQGSAFPDEYDKWEPLATELVEGNQDVDPIS
ncbi:protein-tyrosine-phosphatase [Brevibacterium epidermidis]|jgi:protein-tyrosine-phosphatase|uniref:Protein-tyrosine-phosphatase n=1 Tax=Brevibacterium epidermidis TaxID=1698 RepID=A0ABV4EFV6_BREEP